MSTPRVRHILETAVYCDDPCRTADFIYSCSIRSRCRTSAGRAGRWRGHGTPAVSRGPFDANLFRRQKGSCPPTMQRSVALRFAIDDRRVVGVGNQTGRTRYSDRESRQMGARRAERVLRGNPDGRSSSLPRPASGQLLVAVLRHCVQRLSGGASGWLRCSSSDTPCILGRRALPSGRRRCRTPLHN